MLVAVIDLDPSFVVVGWNLGASRLFGWTATEAIGRPSRELWRSLGDHRTQRRQELLETGEWHGESVFFGKNDRPVVARGRTIQLRDQAGRVVGYRGVLRRLAALEKSLVNFPAISAKPSDTCHELSQTNGMARANLRAVPHETATERRNRRFAYNLRRLRTARGWRQEELALHADVSREQVVHWENGDYGISAFNLEKLCAALELDNDSEFYVPIPEPSQATS